MKPVVRGVRTILHAGIWLWDHSIGFVLTWLLIGVITAYRHTISPTLPPTCRYHPSCSAYGLESMHTHLAVKGSLLTGWRLLRCNPWSKGGVDPVPARGHWLPDVHPNGEPRHGTMGTRSVQDSNV
ncbi:MAG: membrane protein insertion efficiency factor YidD [bacterium]|nr:membrane protein insertion efficiency factor YidD [bacterium]